MCGPWLGKHGVNVQKGALFQLDLFFNPDRFSRKNSTFRLPLSFLKTKFQPCFPLQFQPIQIQFKSPPLFLILSFFTGVSPPMPLALTLSQLLVLVSFSSSLTPETDRLITVSVEAKVRACDLEAASHAPSGL